MKSALIRYYGGKRRLASWVIRHFPAHRVFVDVFGGAGNIIMQKERAKVEIYNDLDDSMYEFFQVMSVPSQREWLKHLVDTMPYSRSAFNDARVKADCPVRRALQILVLSHFGHGSSGLRGRNTGFRSFYGDPIKTASQLRLWREKSSVIDETADRFRGVLLENLDALKLIDRCDRGQRVLLYLDPPYPMGVRKGKALEYAHEMTDEYHEQLFERIQTVKSMLVISGYPGSIYDGLGWEFRETQARTIDASFRTEKIWMNPLASARLDEEAAARRLEQGVQTEMEAMV